MESAPTDPISLPRRVLAQLANLDAAELRCYIAIAAHAPASVRVIAEATAMSKSTIYSALRKLRALGLVVGEGKYWHVAGEGKALEQDALFLASPETPPSRPPSSRAANQHPAIAAFVQIYRFQPSRTDAAAIIAAVGENGGMETWRKALQWWREKRYNPRNVTGMLDVFRRMRAAMPSAEVGEHNADEIMRRQFRANGLTDISDYQGNP